LDRLKKKKKKTLLFQLIFGDSLRRTVRRPCLSAFSSLSCAIETMTVRSRPLPPASTGACCARHVRSPDLRVERRRPAPWASDCAKLPANSGHREWTVPTARAPRTRSAPPARSGPKTVKSHGIQGIAQTTQALTQRQTKPAADPPRVRKERTPAEGYRSSQERLASYIRRAGRWLWLPIGP